MRRYGPSALGAGATCVRVSLPAHRARATQLPARLATTLPPCCLAHCLAHASRTSPMFPLCARSGSLADIEPLGCTPKNSVLLLWPVAACEGEQQMPSCQTKENGAAVEAVRSEPAPVEEQERCIVSQEEGAGDDG